MSIPIIKLRDNRTGNNALCFRIQDGGIYISSSKDNTDGLDGQKIEEHACRMLEAFGTKSLNDLSDEAGYALVLLDDTHVNVSDRKGQTFFTFKKKENEFRLETGNLMGALRFHDKAKGTSVQVEILSRFDKGDNNFFLNYLLSKVFDFALGTETVAAKRSSLLEILLDVVFVRRLGDASRAGLLRHYREFRNNDWNFKGSLDFARHIRENIPLTHGIAYRKREIDLDVPVNRMILMAALTVNRRHPGFFEKNRDAADALRLLRMGVTEERNLHTLISHRDCRKQISHPFFREVWEPLRQIARMILTDEQWTLFPKGTTAEEVSGIVFDGAWLWEEYVAKVLETVGFMHCTERILPVFQGGVARFKPDFYKDGVDMSNDNLSNRIVLDAKYKRSNPFGGRDDVHQMLCYLLLTGAKTGGLIFPPIDDKCEDKESITALENGTEGTVGIDGNGNLTQWSNRRAIASPYSTAGKCIWWKCFSWAPPPEGKDWNAFVTYMQEQETKLRNGL